MSERNDDGVVVPGELLLESLRRVRGRQAELEFPHVRGRNPAHRVLEAIAEQELVHSATTRRVVFYKVELPEALQGVRGGALRQAELVLELSHRRGLPIVRGELHRDQKIDGEELVHFTWT